jgi:hypothetical protein
VDSMLTQHAKWLEQCRDFPWRRPLASLNVLLTSLVSLLPKKSRQLAQLQIKASYKQAKEFRE